MKDKSHSQFTSSRPEAFCKKSVLRNFAKFSGKHLCQSLFLIKRLWCRCFPVNFAKFLRTPILAEHLRWLLTILAKPQHENCPKMEFFSGPYFPVFSPSIGKYGPEKKNSFGHFTQWALHWNVCGRPGNALVLLWLFSWNFLKHLGKPFQSSGTSLWKLWMPYVMKFDRVSHNYHRCAKPFLFIRWMENWNSFKRIIFQNIFGIKWVI